MVRNGCTINIMQRWHAASKLEESPNPTTKREEWLKIETYNRSARATPPPRVSICGLDRQFEPKISVATPLRIVMLGARRRLLLGEVGNLLHF